MKHDDSKKDFAYDINTTGEYRDTWRVFRIMAEFVEGYQFVGALKNTIVFLGGARFKEGSTYYEQPRELGFKLAKSNYSVVTGGGPGVMEAGNRGAFEAKGESIGLNIQLPFEQRINPYVTKSTSFYYFFTRKRMLLAPPQGYVFFPGGFGTMDEFFEVVDYMEIGMLCKIPIVLIGKSYWEPIIEFLKDKVCALSDHHKKEIDSWFLTDSVDEAYEYLKNQENQPRVCELSPMNFYNEMQNTDWKLFRIMAEIVEGMEFLTGSIKNVTILGTKSISKDSCYYESAYNLGRMLGEKKYAVMTGGSIGIAEAANRGVFEMDGVSIGVGLEVYGTHKMNEFVNKSIVLKFPFIRKIVITAPSKGFVFFPGSFGTLHHLFEVLTLIQTGKMPKIPIILFDSKFWGEIDYHIKKVFRDELKTISNGDELLYTITDSEEEVMKILNDFNDKNL